MDNVCIRGSEESVFEGFWCSLFSSVLLSVLFGVIVSGYIGLINYDFSEVGLVLVAIASVTAWSFAFNYWKDDRFKSYCLVKRYRDLRSSFFDLEEDLSEEEKAHYMKVAEELRSQIDVQRNKVKEKKKEKNRKFLNSFKSVKSDDGYQKVCKELEKEGY